MVIKLRMIYGEWWLVLCDESHRPLKRFGPMNWRGICESLSVARLLWTVEQ